MGLVLACVFLLIGIVTFGAGTWWWISIPFFLLGVGLLVEYFIPRGKRRK